MNDPLSPAAVDLEADAELYLSGAADVACVGRLSAALRADDATRQRFVSLARLHAHLGEIGRRTAAGQIGTARLLAVDPAPAFPRRPVARPWRWPAIAAAVAALLVVGLTLTALAVAGLHAQSLVPTVAGYSGAVQVLRAGRPLPLADGLHLRAGDRVLVDPDGSVDIALVGGSCAISGGSEAVVEAYDERLRRVVLIAGGMQANLAGREVFAVRTAAATISLVDAAADIAVSSGRTAVTVRRGSVTVRASGGDLRLERGGTWVSDALPALANRRQGLRPGG